MVRKKPQVLVAVGLLLLSSGLALGAVGPAFVHSDWGDAVRGVLIGIGLTLELAGVYYIAKAKRGAGPDIGAGQY
jgi:hypothetical protein